jgi:type II restriction/modification system DNA methylase subunit YeeA
VDLSVLYLRENEVIGKVVKSEDIPAATQLFTPNWIVKYMVQNTLGRQWLATYPASPLRDRMEYYIEPAEQEPDVQRQLDEITPDQLDQESLTVLDPACGSGHILIEAYELFKAIYLERGYRTRDIPCLILKKNLYGLDIDDRASQLAAFALMMKARADDRQIFDGDVIPNVFAIQESRGLDTGEIARAALASRKADAVSGRAGQRELFPVAAQQDIHFEDKAAVLEQDIDALLGLFENGKTYGSLITIPEEMAGKLPFIGQKVEECLRDAPELSKKYAENLLHFVRQAELLARQYDVVVANPPYMGKKGINADLKAFADRYFRVNKSDTFSMFMQRSLTLSKKGCYSAFVTPFVWMFLSSYEDLRKLLTYTACISSLIQLEYNAFEPACVPVCTFTLLNTAPKGYLGDFIRLSDFRGHQNQAPRALEAITNLHCEWRFRASSDDFLKIPGDTIAYWINDIGRGIFHTFNSISDLAEPRQGLATGNNERYLRLWYEVSIGSIGFGFRSREQAKASNNKWFPCQKGGGGKKWYGHHDYVINWRNDGQDLKLAEGSVIRNQDYYFRAGATWSSLTISSFAMRYNPEGFIFESKGAVCFPYNKKNIEYFVAYGNTKLINYFLSAIAPTLDYSQGPVGKVPIKICQQDSVNRIASEAIETARVDCNAFETSWDFQSFPWLTLPLKASTTDQSFTNWQAHCISQIKRMQDLETENNRLFIKAYGLQDELTPEVPEDQITLARPDRETDIKRLISYALGCMMGRYSLDEPGLIYAHSGNKGFDPSRYKTFPADDDGIIPVMDLDWFPDDAANRFVEFLKVAWSSDTLEDNLKFVAGSLKPKRGEFPTETIRQYLSTNFFKDHLKTYKKRPIYWIFSSGKQKAFECLVYLHRYNEATLSRMRSSYVTPLQGKFNARIEYLRNEIDAVTTASAQKKMQKGLDSLKKKQAELTMFDEKLRHYADKRIELDLDDGVKVNYGKFGDLLAEKKAVTGKK